MTQISFDTAFCQWDRSSHISRCFFQKPLVTSLVIMKSDDTVESFRLFDDDCSWWWSRCSLLKTAVQSTKYFLNSEKKIKNVLMYWLFQSCKISFILAHPSYLRVGVTSDRPVYFEFASYDHGLEEQMTQFWC